LDPEQTRIMTSARDADAGRDGGIHWFELVGGADAGRRYSIGRAGATIGRTPPAEIVLPDSEVSRSHCRLSVEGDDLSVADLNSTNGTFVDDVRVGEPTVIAVGAVLTVGNQSLRLLGRDPPPLGHDRPSARSRGFRGAGAAGREQHAAAAPDIFLSYNREDQATARRFAERFTAEGFEVWWDVTLRSGEAYDEVTEAALRAAKAVVVLWSKRSVASRWVRSEATLGDRNGTLVPAMIEPCERPVMFELTQTAELTHWKGEADDKAWLAFLSDVRRHVDPAGAAKRPRETLRQDLG
jgi:hypothetical protein